MVRFDPAQATFVLNVDHPVVRAHDDEGAARPLLEDLVTAEVLLEVYLREQQLPPNQIGEVLERRDRLMRSLTKDRVYSLANIAADLREASDDEHDLESALVTACRALGFVGKHIAGSDEPDGIARLTDNRAGEYKLTLEAKSSIKIPSLNAIDFASLARHRDAHQAEACLLLAPAYPGSTKGEGAAAAKLAVVQRISCWTVAQLAEVVTQSGRRHISARAVYEICCEAFAPDDVATAVKNLLDDPGWDQRELYRAVLAALRSLEGRLPGTARQVAHVHSELSRADEFRETPSLRSAAPSPTSPVRARARLRSRAVTSWSSIRRSTNSRSASPGCSGYLEKPARPSTFGATSGKASTGVAARRSTTTCSRSMFAPFCLE